MNREEIGGWGKGGERKDRGGEGRKRERRGTHNARMTTTMRSKSATREAIPNRTPNPTSRGVSSPTHHKVGGLISKFPPSGKP